MMAAIVNSVSSLLCRTYRMCRFRAANGLWPEFDADMQIGQIWVWRFAGPLGSRCHTGRSPELFSAGQAAATALIGMLVLGRW
jgi:hypothetical protein